ncbi:myoD family inhibitor domain-containing protein-like [Polyodon spathula]|uniref:myoD family inhibitor domain-containing protein-like n=1 Tax=Polyodon spathula TaxID=7913 RepID=UPI001B7EC0C1|nr:myoD family inhibitor domain-containing protein-like [Polyodon spathula]XP_041129586.1 myoD family inhibitor domain-containing protein-like [Polyodon spathula]
MSECVAGIMDSGKAGDTEAAGPSEVDTDSGPSHSEAEPHRQNGHPSISEHSLAGNKLSANENKRLLPSPSRDARPAHKTEQDAALPQPESPPPHANGQTHAGGVSNGAPPICTPPQLRAGPLVPVRSLQKHHHGNGKRLTTSSYRSQRSIKSTASEIQQAAGEDHCIHCILACLFCEFLSLCSLLVECVACGPGCGEACRCGGGAEACCWGGEESCAAGMDCGLLEDCCESSDCLEICFECCSICFPA